MSKVCPQRILREAIDIIETQIDFSKLLDSTAERLDNNLQELRDLSDRLSKANINSI